MAERVVWIGGYPRVTGVNLPLETQVKPLVVQPPVAPPTEIAPVLPISGNVSGYQGHDLRAGLQRTNSKPKP